MGNHRVASAAPRAVSANGQVNGHANEPAATKVTGTGSDPNATTNYRNLFALYQGLNNLQSIAQAASAKTLSTSQTQQLLLQLHIRERGCSGQM